MKAFKLCRQLKNGDITPLFINKQKRMQFNEWMPAECHPTKGFKVRPFWHCTAQPIAPHLSKKGRVWLEVEIKDFTVFDRPKQQGGIWFLAGQMKILRIHKK